LVKVGILEKLVIKNPVVFDAVETNPTESMVLQAAELYRESGCDGIVAAGGGSPIDLAKCVAILVNHPPPLEQYAILRNGRSRITGNMPPLIAIPTTSGSGSEVGKAALVTVEGAGKLGFLSNHLLPTATICDAELTIDLPPLLTAVQVWMPSHTVLKLFAAHVLILLPMPLPWTDWNAVLII
jgi:alcohol dehydrogenase class IV